MSDLSTLNDIEVLKALVSGGCVLVLRHALIKAAAVIDGDDAVLTQVQESFEGGYRM